MRITRYENSKNEGNSFMGQGVPKKQCLSKLFLPPDIYIMTTWPLVFVTYKSCSHLVTTTLEFRLANGV